jgi:Rhs element Vgr protein
MPDELRAELVIKVGGRARTDMLDDIVEVVVDSNLHLPSMATIELYDTTMEWIDDTAIAVGKLVELTFEAPLRDESAEGTPRLLFKGEVVSLEPIFKPSGQVSLLIRCYDQTHRLHLGKRTRTFLEKSDGDIAKDVAGDSGLTPDVDVTAPVIPYVLQHNQTNMEFLLERAQRIGYWVYASEGKLHFKKPNATFPAGTKLEYGQELIEFRPRISAVGQPGKSIVTGWDIKTKKAVEAKVASATAVKMAKTSLSTAPAALAKTGFKVSDAEAHVVHRNVVDAKDAGAIATGMLESIASEAWHAEGECFGETRLQAGTWLQITGCGSRFSGKYLVTSATHVYRSGVYRTRFVASGHLPYTFSHLVGGAPAGTIDQPASEMPGVTIGVVTNTKDKDGLSRVKVKFPWLPKYKGAEIESSWARLSAPMAGKQRGFMFMPAVNDEVLVAFEHGDPSAPYILGGLWNGKDKSPQTAEDASKDGKTTKHMIKTGSGHVIILDDTPNKESISITDKTTKNMIIISSKENTITIKAEKDMVFEAKGKITIKAAKDILFEGLNVKYTAKAKYTVDASGPITLGTKATVKIEATKVDVLGKAGVGLKTSGLGIVDISPAKVTINNGGLEVM